MRPFNRQHHFTKTSVFCFSLVELVKGRQSINLRNFSTTMALITTHTKKSTGAMASLVWLAGHFVSWNF